MAFKALLDSTASNPLGRHRSIWTALHLDPILLLLLLLLVSGGLFVLYSGADRNLEVVKAQGIRLGVAFVVMLVFAQLDPSVFRRWAPWLYAAGIVALIAVMLVGVGAKGMAGIFVVFFAGISWKLITAFVALVSVSAPLMWFFVMREYQKQRVLTLLDPQSDPLGAGWNIIQSKTAIGSGGVDGKGWLQGTQSHLEFLPESHTDFIVAVLAEEFGFVGMLILMTVYFLIILRCLYIAATAQDSFSRLLAGALTMTFFIYIFVNVGMVSGLLPVVGVPLPLISYGGTSGVTLMAAFGVLMSIHTHRRMIGA